MEPKHWYESATLRTAIGLFLSVLYFAVPKVKDSFESGGVTVDSIFSLFVGVGSLVSVVVMAVKRLTQPVQQPIKGSPADPTK